MLKLKLQTIQINILLQIRADEIKKLFFLHMFKMSLPFYGTAYKGGLFFLRYEKMKLQIGFFIMLQKN